MILGIDASRANNLQKTGVEWYAYHLIEEMKKIVPEEIRVVLYSDIPLQGELAVLPKNWENKVLHWPPKRLWTQIRMSYEMLFHAPDVLFIPAHVFPLLHPKKTVMTVHDVAALRFKESFNWFERWYSLWSPKFAVKSLWQVIVPSEFTKKEIKDLQFKNWQDLQDKIQVVHHGFDKSIQEKKSAEEVETVLKKYKIQKPYLVSIGRLEEKKNTWRIIEAFDLVKKHYPYHQLVLIGKPGFGYEKVEQTIEYSAHKKDILTPGWVAQGDIPTILQNADVFVFPSLYEGFGIPFLEAASAGVPALLSTGSSLEEIAGDSASCVDPLSVEAIAAGISELLRNENLKTELISRAKQRTQDFSWEKCAKQTVDILLKN